MSASNRCGGRDLGAMSGAVVGTSVLAGLAVAMARSDYPYPRPGSSGAEIRRYFTQPSRAASASAVGQAVSALALARFTVTVARLARRAPGRATALRAGAPAGGTIATARLATSAAIAATLTVAHVTDDERAQRLARRAFVAGGPLHGVGFGLLVGVLGDAGRRTGELAPALSLTAIATVAPNFLGPLYLLAEPAGWFIPAGRFPGLIIAALAGAQLSRQPARPPHR